MAQQPPPSCDDEMIRAPEVLRLLGGVSLTWLKRRLDPLSPYFDRNFPRPLQYQRGGPRYWPRAEIIAYREGKRGGPDTAVKPRTAAALMRSKE
jgi:predicted DNA-binding transcriptional regulator AlpA